MIEKLSECAKVELDKGIEQIDAKELGEVAEIIKELAEAEYYAKISKAMDESEYGEDYDEYGAYDESRKGYRGQPRSESGRFMSRGDGRRSNRGRGGRRGYEEPMYYTMTPEMYHDYTPEMLRDMDKESMGRMYYSSGNMGSQSSSGMSGGQSSGGSQGGSRAYSERGEGGRGQSSRSENARRGYEESKMMQDGSPESKKKAMENLENYLKELSEDMTELVGKMDSNEKSMVKNKLQVLAQKVQ